MGCLSTIGYCGLVLAGGALAFHGGYNVVEHISPENPGWQHGLYVLGGLAEGFLGGVTAVTSLFLIGDSEKMKDYRDQE